jgi:hypothetical protein
MTKGYTEKEAKRLIGKSFATHAPVVGVPVRTRGRVVSAFDADDHWNVMIEWILPGPRVKSWYSKYDIQTNMHPVEGE